MPGLTPAPPDFRSDISHPLALFHPSLPTGPSPSYGNRSRRPVKKALQEYYSAIEKNEIMPFAATWMDLEIIIQSKSKKKKQISYDINYTWNLKK